MTVPTPASKFTADAELAEAEHLIRVAFPGRVTDVAVAQTMSRKYAFEFIIPTEDGGRDTVEFTYRDTLERATHRTIRRIAAILAEGA